VIFTRFAGPNWEQDTDLQAPLIQVDRFFHSESEQHPMRRWEYAMAGAAWREWDATVVTINARVLDVGGAGSPLKNIFASPFMSPVEVVDPKLNYGIEAAPLIPPADAIFSISVLEHVEDPYDFLEACVRRLALDGLLFLTVDAWDPLVETQKDTAHFHWMRKRIFTRGTINHVIDTLGRWGLRPFGEIDLEYKGNTVYDYTFASICMKKEG
jgi:SAM-dependent methyltransferase